jgi:lysophospholipase L1-like esterase
VWKRVAGLLAVLALGGAQPDVFAIEGHWVTTWGCGPQLTGPRNRPPVPLADSTLRQFVHTTLGGKQLRVRFSNADGADSVTLTNLSSAYDTGDHLHLNPTGYRAMANAINLGWFGP